MKKSWVLVLISMALGGCAGGTDEKTSPAADDGAKPLIYASNYPLAYFAERIATPVADVRFPVPDDGDPAYWKPTLDDVVAIQQADLVVLNGASYESWLENVSLPPSKMVVTTDGLRDRLIPLEKDTTHSHGLVGEHEHSGTAFTTWLDPALAAAQAGAIKDALAARWPQRSDRFEAQLAELAQELTALDTAAQEAVAGNPELPVLFSHPVYQYLVHRYGLNAVSVHWEPDQMPDEAQWKELIAIVGDFPATWMIWEDAPLPEIRERLETLGIHSVVFDPCADIPASGDFLSVMEENVRALTLVFGAESPSTGG